MKRLLVFLVALCMPFFLYAGDITVQVDGIFYNIQDHVIAHVVNGWRSDNTGLYSGDITIPANLIVNREGDIYYPFVKGVGHRAFADCPDLTSVTFEDNYNFDYMGREVFRNCTSLQYVNNFPQKVTCLDYCLFEGCRNLSSFTISNNVTRIEAYAFYCCEGLSSIILPDNVTTVGYAVFYGCSGISSPIYNSSIFAYMPKSYSGAYSIPSTINTIAGGAFLSCRNLTEVTIPDQVNKIDKKAFGDNIRLKIITCEAVTPPSLGESVFGGLNCSQIKLYVPDGSVESYKSADQWKEFYILPISSKNQSIENVQIEDESTQKVLRDGQVIIYNGDKEYNIIGTEL